MKKIQTEKEKDGKETKGGDQMDMLLAGIDAEQVREKYPSFRFSEEIYLMIDQLVTKLKTLDYDPIEYHEHELCQESYINM